MMNPGKQIYRSKILSLWIWALLVAVLMAVIVPGAQAALSENRTRAYHNFFTDRTGLEPDLKAELHWVYSNFYDDFASGSLVAPKKGTEVVQRAMSRAEMEATRKTGLLRGGREGTHYVSDAVNTTAKRARQRLGLPVKPEVRVTMEVPKGKFSPPSRTQPFEVQPGKVLPGGGMERTATGNIPVKILDVRGY